MGALCSKDGSVGPERKERFLANSPFSIYLTPETGEAFSKCFTTSLRLSPGKTITSLDADKVYVVCEGEVDISTSYPDKCVKFEAKGFLCRKRKGDVLLIRRTQEEIQEQMTVKTSHKVQGLADDLHLFGGGDTPLLLLSADMDDLDQFTQAHPELKPIRHICNTNIQDRLSEIPFLCCLPKKKLAVLACMCRYESAEEDEVVFKEGSESDKLYLIVSGRAQVVANRIRNSSESHLVLEQRVTLQRSLECNGRPMCHGVEEITIAELDSGAFFGEQGLVFGTTRACGVKTVEKSLLLSVSKSDFANFVKICPLAKQELVKSVKRRMLQRMESLQIPFLAGIPSDMISSLADSVQLDEFPANTIIFSQGEEGDRFFIIVHGSVRVTETGSNAEEYSEAKEIGVLGPGSYFGELSLLEEASQLRTATVATVDRALLLSVDKESFRTIFGNAECPLQAEFELRLLRESASLQHVLNHPLGMESFRDFLKNEHAEENLDFVNAINSFRRDTDSSHGSHIQAQAQLIFDTHVSETSQSQVNLPAKMVDDIRHALGTKSAHSGVFLDAHQEIMQMMEHDNFSRYKQSRYFKAFKERLGIL